MYLQHTEPKINQVYKLIGGIHADLDRALEPTSYENGRVLCKYFDSDRAFSVGIDEFRSHAVWVNETVYEYHNKKKDISDAEREFSRKNRWRVKRSKAIRNALIGDSGKAKKKVQPETDNTQEEKGDWP